MQQAHAVVEEVQRKTAEYTEETRPSPGSYQFGKATGLLVALAAIALALLAHWAFA